MGVLVCFESLFPGHASALSRMGSEVLVVVTNDTWFGTTAAPTMHAIFSALRAAENARFVLRAATSGVSVIIDPRGRRLGTVPLNQMGLLVEEIHPRQRLTLYTRWGNWICWICLFVLCLDFMALLKTWLQFRRRGGRSA